MITKHKTLCTETLHLQKKLLSSPSSFFFFFFFFVVVVVLFVVVVVVYSFGFWVFFLQIIDR